MSFTVLFAAFAVLALLVIFGLAYKIKGLKTAFIATGIGLVAFAALFMAMIYVIVGAM